MILIMVSDARRERFNQLDWSLDLLMIGALLELKSLVASAKWVHFWNMRKLKHIFLWKVILPSFSFWTLFGEVTFSSEERGLSTGSRFIEEMKGRSDFCFTEWLLGTKQTSFPPTCGESRLYLADCGNTFGGCDHGFSCSRRGSTHARACIES